jgi:hypothetical protein
MICSAKTSTTEVEMVDVVPVTKTIMKRMQSWFETLPEMRGEE